MQDLQALVTKFAAGQMNITTPDDPFDIRPIKLGDPNLFALRIGTRVLKKDVFQKRTGVPLFSANVHNAFGFVPEANAGGHKYGGALWGIDFDCRGVPPGEIYAITDHCGEVAILVKDIEPHYLARQIRVAGIDMGLDRDFRASLAIMKDLEINLPITASGEFDVELMQAWTDFHEDFLQRKQSLAKLIA